jgi:hypothetical protein
VTARSTDELVTGRRVNVPSEARKPLELLPPGQRVRQRRPREVPHAPPSLAAFSPGIEPENRGPACGAPDQVKREADRRALARSVRTEVAEDLTALDAKLEIHEPLMPLA